MAYEQAVKRQSIRFYATLGLTPGYSPEGFVRDEAACQWNVHEIAYQWNAAAHDSAESFGVHPPSAVIHEAVAAYQIEADAASEPIVVLTGTLNPFWGDDREAWRATVLDVMQRLGDRYGQETVQVNFEDVEVTYYLRTPLPCR